MLFADVRALAQLFSAWDTLSPGLQVADLIIQVPPQISPRMRGFSDYFILRSFFLPPSHHHGSISYSVRVSLWHLVLLEKFLICPHDVV